MLNLVEEYYTTGEQKFLFRYETETDTQDFYERYTDLYRSCFGNREYISKDWFNWINLDCPFGKSNVYTVTDTETNILAGAYTLLAYKAQYKGEEITLFLCCNVMTRPEYGGKGLFTQIGAFALKHAIQGTAMALGIPNESALKGHLKIDWKELPELYFVQKDKALFTGKDSTALISDDLNVLSTFNFNAFNKKYTLAVHRSFDFIKWRYIQKKTSTYSCCYTEENGKVTGFAIFKLYEDTEHNQRKLHIVDYCVTDEQALKPLLHKIESYALDAGIDLINTWDLTVEHSPAYQVLLQEQYHASPSFNRFILYPSAKVDTSDMANWHIVLGDNDVF